MTEPREKNSFTKRLSSLFSRKAKPAPVPPEVYNDPRVHKAVFKARRRRFFKRLLVSSVAAAAISTGTHYFPDSVSTPFNQHMAEQGHAANFGDHFHAANIRVYDRWNPLYPFHLAGLGAKMSWRMVDEENEGGAFYRGASKAVGTAVIYPAMLFKGFTTLAMPHPLDAFAVPNTAPHAERDIFIRPPGKVNLEDFIKDFGRVNSDTLKFKNDTKEIERVLYEYIMLHEARHGDQRSDVATSLNEADADKYAFRVLEARGNKQELLTEVRDIITHSRTMASVLGGGTSHTTSLALLRPHQSPYESYKDEAALKRLHDVLNDADAMNSGVFGDNIGRGNRLIYLAAAINKSGVADRDPDMKQALGMFLRASLYFDSVTGGGMITNFDIDKINVDYLRKEYKPVEDKLQTPAAAAPKARPAMPRG